MKKLVFMLMLTPLFGAAQQTVLSTNRVFPKADKVLEFEKAMGAHAQKYHTGTFRWRVFEITSGPDAGGYHVTEGPMSWDEIDKRGNLGAEHNNDWNKSVAPFLLDRSSSSYAVFQEDLSTVQLTDYSDWINITRLAVNPGYMDDLRAWVGKMKKVWEENKTTMAVYSNSSSGINGFALVTRYKQGLKERSPGTNPPFRDVYEKINGRDSWMRDYLAPLRVAVKESSSELLHLRADLSSK
jgi:hypothetical protein